MTWWTHPSSTGLCPKYGNEVEGPAIVVAPTTTVAIPPGYAAGVSRYGNFLIESGGRSLPPVSNGRLFILAMEVCDFRSIPSANAAHVSRAERPRRCRCRESSALGPLWASSTHRGDEVLTLTVKRGVLNL